MRVHEIQDNGVKKRINQFAQWAIDSLELDPPPEIQYSDDLELVKSKKTFGTTRSDGVVWLYIGNRNAADVCRTLVHELIHVKQFQVGAAFDGMPPDYLGRIEDQANSFAARFMRVYGRIDSTIYESADVSISKMLDRLAAELQQLHRPDYRSIDSLMRHISADCGVTPHELHDAWVDEYGVTPDEWITGKEGTK